MERKKYTNIDFSQHEVKVEKSEFATRHTLYLPDKGNYHKVIFLNSGIMAVHGDFGNWIFCREFIPNEKTSVSPEYWAEKLCISSNQESHEFDMDRTMETIKEYRDRAVEDEEGELADFYETVIRDGITSSEYEYYHDMYDAVPDGYDPYAIIPVEKSIKFWLLCVMDAWNMICEKMEGAADEQKAD